MDQELKQRTQLFSSKTKEYFIFIAVAFLLFVTEDILKNSIFDFLFFGVPVVFSLGLVLLLFYAFYSKNYLKLFFFSLIIYILISLEDVILTYPHSFGSGFLSFHSWYFIKFLFIVFLLNKISQSFEIKDRAFHFIVFIFFGLLILTIAGPMPYISLVTPASFENVLSIALFRAILSSLIIAPIFYYLIPKIRMVRFLKVNY